MNVSEQSVSQHRKRKKIEMELLVSLHLLVLEYKKTHPGCGKEKLYYQLKPKGIGRDKFVDFLTDLGLGVHKKKNYKKTTTPGFIEFPNCIEGKLVHNINQVWQSDITYFPFVKTHYYITFIIDVYSKYIIAHKVANTLEAQHNLSCLKQAIRKRKITKNNMLIHHSDKGSQYTSFKYMLELKKYNILKSMGIKGQDNAYAERINGTIKNEYLVYRNIKSYQQLKMWAKQAVNHYNLIRIHNGLPGKMSPQEFEKKIVNLEYQERPKVIIYADGNKSIKEEKSFLNSLPKKDLRAHICPINLNY